MGTSMSALTLDVLMGGPTERMGAGTVLMSTRACVPMAALGVRCNAVYVAKIRGRKDRCYSRVMRVGETLGMAVWSCAVYKRGGSGKNGTKYGVVGDVNVYVLLV